MKIPKVNCSKKNFESINKIALTTDGWSLVAIDLYSIFTGYYFNECWELYSITLSIEEIEETDTVDHLKDQILNIMDA